MAEICTFCLQEATDYYEFQTGTHPVFKKGEIKAVCPKHLVWLKAGGR